MSILVICPSRGRPDKAREAASSLVSTRQLGDTEMLVAFDADDELASEYMATRSLYRYMMLANTGGMVASLNEAVRQVLTDDFPPDIIGFIGDDHRFRTDGWDEAITKALASPGFAYGHDGMWRDGRLPTQVFISREIVQALGYYALPTCRHLYVDNAWKALGDATDCIRWLSEIMIEHMHPMVQKAEWDEGYRRVNNEEMYEHDRVAFEHWLHGSGFREDVAKVRAVVR